MTLAFDDTFNRADGDPGDGWYIDSGNLSIYNNALRTTVVGRGRPNRDPVGVNACQRAWVLTPASFTKTIRFRFRQDVLQTTFLQVSFVLGAASIVVSSTRFVAGVQTSLSSITVPYTWGTVVDLMCSVANNAILAWVDGYLALANADYVVTNAGSLAIDLQSTNMYVDRYSFYDLDDTSLQVEIVEDTGGAPHYVVTLHNAGADWTPGTPGQPIFVPYEGTITSQSVTDENTATLHWTSPSITMQALIEDPQNQWPYHIELTNPAGASGPGGGGGGLTPEQAESIRQLGIYLNVFNVAYQQYPYIWLHAGAVDAILSTGYVANAGGSLGQLLDAILAEDGRLAIIDAQSYSAMTLANSMSNAGVWTLQTVWQQVQGSGAHNIADILNAIADLSSNSGTDLDAILAELAAIRTASLWTLEHVRQWILAIPPTSLTPVLNELALIRTANFWTLGHVMDAIANIPTTDYAPQLTTIDNHVLAIPTNPVTSLTPVLDAIAAVRGTGNPDLAALLTAINLRPTNPITSLTPVLDAIAAVRGAGNPDLAAILTAINNLTPGAGTPTAPVWPGAANVTLGAPHNLATGLTIAANMDGVIVNITGAPTKQGYFTYDNARSWRNLGSLSFYDDSGHQEFQQFLGFESAVYCPKVMTRAAGVKIRTVSGVSGTVTGWTINTA